MMKTIGEVGLSAAAQREVLLDHAAKLNRGCEEALGQAEDVEAVKERHRAVARLLQSPDGRLRMASEWMWLAGSA